MKRRNVAVGGAAFGPRERELVNQVLDTTRLTYGPLTARFERQFAKLHDRKFAIFMNSGTSALHVGLDALKLIHGWRADDEVLVPALTFVASANVVLHNGLRPVFVEIDPVHYEMDPARIEERVTARTRAIMPVHLFGQPCDMDPIMDIARRHRLAVIEDSCETMYARYHGRVTGSWGEVSCFSTYVAHLLVTGVGGFATADDPEIAIRMKSLANHGRDAIYMSIDDDDSVQGTSLFNVVDRRFKFVDAGYSYRATEFEAAIGLGQLETWREAIAARQSNARLLTERLESHGDLLQLPSSRPDTEHVFMMYPIVVKPPLDRDALVHDLETNGIETRPMLPLLSQPVYLRLFGDMRPEYPIATHVEENGFYVGCHPGVVPDDIDYVAHVFDEFIARTLKERNSRQAHVKR